MIYNDVFYQGVGKDQEYLPTKHGFDHYTVSCQIYTSRFRGVDGFHGNPLSKLDIVVYIYNLQFCCMLNALRIVRNMRPLKWFISVIAVGNVGIVIV